MFRLAHPSLANGMFSFSSRNIRNLSIEIELCNNDDDDSIDTASSGPQSSTSTSSVSRPVQPRARTPFPFGLVNDDSGCPSPSDSDTGGSSTSIGEWNNEVSEGRPRARTPFRFGVANADNDCTSPCDSDTDSSVLDSDEWTASIVSRKGQPRARTPFPFGVANNCTGCTSPCDSDADSSVLSIDEPAAPSVSRKGQPRARTPFSFGVSGCTSPCDSDTDSSVIGTDEWDDGVSDAPSSASLFSECLYCDGQGEDHKHSGPDTVYSESVYSRDVDDGEDASSGFDGARSGRRGAIDGTWIDPYSNAEGWASHEGEIDGRPAAAFLYQSGVGTLTDYPVSTSPRMTAQEIHQALSKWCTSGSPESKGCNKEVGCTITYENGSYPVHQNGRFHQMVSMAAQFQAFDWDSSYQPRTALARETTADDGVFSPKDDGFSQRLVPTEELGPWTGQHVTVQDLVGELQ